MKTSIYTSSLYVWIVLAVAILTSTRTGVVLSQNVTDTSNVTVVDDTDDDTATTDDDEDMTTIMPTYAGGPIESPSGSWAVVPAPNEPATAPVQNVPNPTEVPVAAPTVAEAPVAQAPSETQPSEVVQPVFESPTAPAPISGAAAQINKKTAVLAVAAAILVVAAL